MLLVVCAGLLGLATVFGPPNETNDVADYRDVLKQWSGTGLTSHFPPTIPPQAGNTRFAAFPGYLQGGGYLQLRVQLPASQVAAIESQAKEATLHMYVGGGMFDHYNKAPSSNWPTATFHASDDPKTQFDFPDHYTLYVLSAKDQANESWNHGETTGIAISKTANEVVYWAESW